jgi:hypothetical protein
VASASRWRLTSTATVETIASSWRRRRTRSLCLEIVTTAAPPLVCRGDAAPEVAVLEFDLDGIEEAGTTPCDPSGAAITVWSGADAPRSPPQVPASAAPAIPTGRALVLLGGDAAAVLAWQGPGQRWAWVPLGY